MIKCRLPCGAALDSPGPRWFTDLCPLEFPARLYRNIDGFLCLPRSAERLTACVSPAVCFLITQSRARQRCVLTGRKAGGKGGVGGREGEKEEGEREGQEGMLFMSLAVCLANIFFERQKI